MTSSTVVLVVALGYLAVCLVLGILPGKRQSKSAIGYVAGDRSLGLWLMYFITGATIFSAFAFLGGPGWAYSRGAAAFYILAYGALGFVPFYFTGPRAARLGRAFGFVTQAEMVAHRFSCPALAGAMAIISAVSFVPYLALQMKGSGYVLSAVTRGGIPEWLGAALVYGAVLFYVFRSGVLGVGWTNTFQGIFMMVLAWGLGLYLPYHLYGGVGEMFRRIAAERPNLLMAPGLTPDGATWSWGEYSTAVLISIVGFSMWPHLFMKAFTAKDDRTIRRTVVLYPTFQIFIVPLFLIGFCGVFFEPSPVKADQILPHMLMNMEIPAILVGLFCAGALAASMSSGDAMAHAAASILVRDGWHRAAKQEVTPESERRLIRTVLVVVVAVSYLLAVGYQGSLVILLLSAYGAVVQFAPAVIATLYIPRVRGHAVLTGLLTGCALTALLLIFPDLRPWPLHAGIYGLALNVFLLAGISWAFPRSTHPEEAAFLEVARGEKP
jgi:SSS family solute:Na+ symporter